MFTVRDSEGRGVQGSVPIDSGRVLTSLASSVRPTEVNTQSVATHSGYCDAGAPALHVMSYSYKP